MSTSIVPSPLPDAVRAGADEEDAQLIALVDRWLAGDLVAWHELWKKVLPLVDAVTASRDGPTTSAAPPTIAPTSSCG